MKNYTTTKGELPINWSKLLNRDCKTMEYYETVEMSSNASSWVTCACGNQCAIIPRDEGTSKPNDTKLRNLGLRFYNNIQHMSAYVSDKKIDLANKHRRKAINTLNKIEKRSSELIFKIRLEKIILKDLKKLNK